jgi:phosphatidylglycerophosphate synthase
MLKSKGALWEMSVKIGMIFSKVGLSPNQWTILALVPAVLGFVALLYSQLLLGAVLFIFSGLIDAIDGAVARVIGAVSNLGAFLDGIIDRYVEILLYMGLLFFLLNNYTPEILIPHAYWIALLIFGAMMPTFVRSYADHRNVVTEPEEHKRMGGLLERAERLGLIFAGMVLGYFNTTFLIYIIVTTAVLSHITSLQRIIFVVSFSSSEASSP